MIDKKYTKQIDLDTFRNLERYEQIADKIILNQFLATMPNDLKIPYDIPLYIKVNKIPYSEWRYCKECEEKRININYAKDLQPFDIEIEIKEIEKYEPIIEMPNLEPHPVEIRYVERPTLWQRFKKWLKEE